MSSGVILAFPEPSKSEQASQYLSPLQYLIFDETDNKTQTTVYSILQKETCSTETRYFKTRSARDAYISDHLQGYMQYMSSETAHLIFEQALNSLGAREFCCAQQDEDTTYVVFKNEDSSLALNAFKNGDQIQEFIENRLSDYKHVHLEDN